MNKFKTTGLRKQFWKPFTPYNILKSECMCVYVLMYTRMKYKHMTTAYFVLVVVLVTLPTQGNRNQNDRNVTTFLKWCRKCDDFLSLL